jgi:hypothetical protein|tara:strand:+ start:13 stop:198 length:186 start_codon:yes stop_codon:yes gene_type:complete
MTFNNMHLHGVTKIEIKEDKFDTFTSFNVTATDKEGNEFRCSFFVNVMEELEYTNEVVIGK